MFKDKFPKVRAGKLQGLLLLWPMRHPAANSPVLLLIAGLPASGKTWLARHLAENWGAVHVNSDQVRAFLKLRGQYDPKAKQAVYTAMLQKAGEALGKGQMVIVDSTFYKNSLRQAWVELAKQCHVPYYFIEIKIPEAAAYKRLQKKREDSEADWGVYQQLKMEWEPFENGHLTLDSDKLSLEEMTLAVNAFLAERP